MAIRNLFQPPGSFLPEQAHRLRLFWTIEVLVAASFTFESLVEMVILPQNAARWLVVIVVVNSAALALYGLARSGRVRLAGLLFVVVLWGLVTGLAISENGVRAPTVDIAYLVIILVAGLVLDERAGFITGVLCALTLLGLTLAGVQGLLPASTVNRSIWATWEADVFYLAIVIGLQYLALHSIKNALDQAHAELLERRRVEAHLREVEQEQARNQMQAELNHLLNEHLENERLKIARDLHDGPVQDLIAATFTLQGLVEDLPDPALKERLAAVQAALHAQVGGLRAFAGELRSPTLAKFGLSRAIREHLERFQEDQPGLAVALDTPAEEPFIPEDLRQGFFRIYQEVMRNVARHAQATEVTVRLGLHAGCLLLQIRDNGVGFTPPGEWMELARQGHLGLVGIRERAETLGGHFDVVSRPGQGTTARAVIPLDHASEQRRL